MEQAARDAGGGGGDGGSGASLGLPSGYRLRAPRRDDAEAVAELTRAVERSRYETADTTTDAVLEEWALPRLEPGRDLWLVEREGDLAGYGLFWEENPPSAVVADQTVHPGHRGHGLSEILLGLAEARALDCARRAPDGVVSLGVSCDAHDEGRLALFAHHGFAHARTFLRMETSLAGHPFRPVWPRGLVVRTFRPGADDAAVHASSMDAFQDHFRPMAMSLEEWRALRFSRRDLDVALWFVAWDGDEVAGSALSFALPDAGLVDELSVCRPWRGRGLGRALLTHSLAALQERGLPRAFLGVDSANPTGAMQLYESAGMSPTREHAFFERDLVAKRTPRRAAGRRASAE